MPRPPVLDEYKRREILAILSVGCSRRTAARYVGCAAGTIQNTAERDEAFASRLRKAEQKAEIELMKSIQRAAAKEQYWRAAAWALERINPEDYAPRRPETMTVEQLGRFLVQLSAILVEEVPIARHRKNVLARVEQLVAGVGMKNEESPKDE